MGLSMALVQKLRMYYIRAQNVLHTSRVVFVPLPPTYVAYPILPPYEEPSRATHHFLPSITGLYEHPYSQHVHLPIAPNSIICERLGTSDGRPGGSIEHLVAPDSRCTPRVQMREPSVVVYQPLLARRLPGGMGLRSQCRGLAGQYETRILAQQRATRGQASAKDGHAQAI